MLKSNLNDVAVKLGGEFTKQLGGITQSVQGELNKIVPGVDVNKFVPKDLDPGKALGGLLGGDKDKDKKKK